MIDSDKIKKCIMSSDEVVKKKKKNIEWWMPVEEAL